MTPRSHTAPLRRRRSGDGLTARQRRAAVAAGAAVSAVLVPWSGVLAATLPETTAVRHWRLAWCGLDLGEAAAAAATAWLLARRDRRAATSATALATLLAVDAWFDVCTATPGRPFAIALAEAVLLELPLAAAAVLAARLDARSTAGEGHAFSGLSASEHEGPEPVVFLPL